MPPQHTFNRLAETTFLGSELLYRRYLRSHLEDGELDPSAIRFHEPPSVLRGRFSVPEDAIHSDCAEGKPVSGFGVLAMPARSVQCREIAKNGTDYEFIPVHKPLPSCYSHAEIHCQLGQDPSGQHIEPPKEVRRAFRLRIAQALAIAIPAP